MKTYFIFLLLLSPLSYSQDFTKEFTQLINETNTWRSMAFEFLEELDNNPSKIITSEELNIIHKRGTLRYKSIRDRFYNIINTLRYLSDYEAKDLKFDENLPSGIIKHEFPLSSIIRNQGNVFAITYEYYQSKKYSINVNFCDDETRNLILSFKIALASALILYDNYTLVIAQLEGLDQKAKLDYVINYDNSEVQNFLEEVEKDYSSLDNFKAMVRSLSTYEKVSEELVKNDIAIDELEKFVDTTIKSSFIYSMRDQIDRSTVWKKRFELSRKWIKNKLNYKKSQLTNGLSKAFGNTMGLVATRRGKLELTDRYAFKKLVNNIKSQLKPMDILLEKTPFRLTDKFIPGHWGHVAIWLGTEKQLKETGHWNLLSEKIQRQVQHGKSVLEALRGGVELNTLKHFLNVDDLAVLRPNFIDKKNKNLEYYVKRSLDQIGKEYDFNFDVETDKKIVCSELTYVVFNKKEFKWPLDKTLGRYTISPDHVAQRSTKKVIDETKFSFTPFLLYLNGKKVTEKDTQALFESLL